MVKKPSEIVVENVITPRVEFLNTGSVLLNLAMSGKGRTGGYARGRIVNIVGDGSSGKCVKNAYILGRDIGLFKIDVIGEDMPIGTTEWEQNLNTSKDVDDLATHFYKEEITNTIKIVTRHGFTLEGTQKHPILIWTKNCTFVMKKLSDIQEGDVAVIARDTNIFVNELQKNILPIPRQTANAKPVSFPENFTEEMGRLFGYIIADGNISKNAVFISNTDNNRAWLRGDIDNILNPLGLSLSASHSITSCFFADYARCIIDERIFTARYKTVPNIILKSPKNVQANFLRGLIDCDGWYNGKGQLDYYTASDELAKQVHLMLLNFGIVGNLSFKQGAKIGEKYYDHKYWTIRICGRNLNTYAKEIGSNKERYKFIEACEKSKSNFDSIPFLLEKILEDREILKTKLGWSKNGTLTNGSRFHPFKTSGVDNLSWDMLSEFIRTHEQYKSVTSEFDFDKYVNIQCSGYHFDPVISIEQIKEQTMVYDVHVPKTNHFWCNGFVSHNTLLAIEACAQAFYNLNKNATKLFPAIKSTTIVYNNVEGVMDFPLEEMYGEKFVKGIEWLKFDTIEHSGNDFLRRVKNLKKGEFLLYIMDSLDAMSSTAGKKRAEDSIEKDKMQEGSYGMEKAKYLSNTFFPRACDYMEGKDATLICISQVRDNINAGLFGAKHYRVGGKALDFYTHQVAWLAKIANLSKEFRAKKKVYGVRTKVKLNRNKVAKPFREAEFDILFDYGVDDIGSMLNYLYGSAKEIFWNEEEMKRIDLIKRLEDSDDEREVLAGLVEDDWKEIEDKIKPKRKRRFQ